MIKKTLSSLKIIRNLILVSIVAFVIAVFAPSVSAQAIHRTSDFNHLKTGFPLTGAHINVDCETCHVGGVFKGTPTNCAGCHSAGRRVVAPFKPANHLITNAPCDSCHTNTVSFLGARFNHIGVQPNACTTCHNGNMGPGKPNGHVATIASCDTCHRSSSWIPAGFDHLSAVPPVSGRCNQCHNGVTATGKYSQHIVTSASCDTCHTTGYTTFAGLKFNHAGVVPGACGTCHSGQTAGAPTQPPGHIPYTGNGCDNCHRTPPATTSFYPATMNHAVISLGCSTCHNGAYISQGVNFGGAKAKVAGHVSTTAQCNVCHHDAAYSTFVGGVMDHTGIVNNCTSCHGTGTNGAKTKTPGVHIPTNNSCESCHSNSIFTSFPGAGATMNHAVEAATGCSVCHSGSYTSQGSRQGGAMVKPNNHIPTTITGSLECNTCHISTSSWTSEKMNHNGTTTGCKTCHNNGTSYLGSMTKMTLGSHQGSKATDDCSQSGCHRPLGNQGTSWVKWN